MPIDSPLVVFYSTSTDPIIMSVIVFKLGNLLAKYQCADDTYLAASATNVDSHAFELDNTETWAKANNLPVLLNCITSDEHHVLHHLLELSTRVS